MMKRLAVCLALMLVFLVVGGCARTIPPAPTAEETALQLSAFAALTSTMAANTPSPTPESAASPRPTETVTLVPLATPISNEAGLTIEENEIVGKIEIEPLKFRPRHGSQAAVMARHAGEKQEPFSYQIVFDSEGSALVSGPYRAIQKVQGNTLLIEVEQGGEVIYRTAAGQISPILTLQRLWTDAQHWTLEIAYVTKVVNDNAVSSFPIGRIYQDGVLLNGRYGYEEMFGYQEIDGRPFYFYKKDGQIRISYNNEDLPIVYNEVPHYNCCSGAEVNPVAAGNWIGFFGKRGETWYYTEIGKY